MVNRVMEAKALKLQRQIRRLPRPLPDTTPQLYMDNKVRAIPKAYSAEAVVAPRQPNSELMEGYKHRALSLGREDKPGRFTGKTEPRLLVEQHLERIRAHCPDDLSFTILSTRVHRARVFYNSQRTAYVLLYENFMKQECRSSLPHASKFELVAKFQRNNIQWVEYIPTSSSGGF